MASTYTPLGVEKMATGENAGTWGTKTNTNLQIIEQFAGGFTQQAVTDGADTDLSVTDGNTGATLAHRVIEFTGTLSASRNVTIPIDVQTFYLIKNSCTDVVVFKYVSGSGNSVTLQSGDIKMVYATANHGTNPDIDEWYTNRISGTLTVGVDDTGYDVKFFGATSGKYMLWDESADSLLVSGVITGDTIEATADTSSGDNAAIGYTASEGLILTGQGSTNDVTIKNDADGDTAASDNAAIGYTATEGLILTGQGSTSDVTIKNDADATVISIPTGTTNVGIGTTAPDRELTVGGVANARIGILSNDNSVGACQLHFGDADNSQIGRIMYEHDGNKMTFHTNASEAMRIDSSGNVLVGKTSTTRNVIGAEIRTTGFVRFTRDQANPLELVRTTDDGEVIKFYKDNTLVGNIGLSSSGISIALGGTGSANTLDDYEEGTFTVQDTDGGGSNQSGMYTKIGDLVTCFFYLTTGAISGSDTFYLTNLPFTVGSTDAYRGPVSIAYTTATNMPLAGNVVENSTTAYLLIGTGDIATDDEIGSSKIIAGSIIYRV